jgi:predicted alpha/beta-hydrolase family hydrolase
MAVAGGLPAAGLVLVSFPLHPPGKKDQLRTEHFPRLKVPCLLLSGDRDAFATPDELAKAARAIRGDVTQVVVEGADHGMRGKDDVVAAIVRDWLREHLA